MINVLNVLVCSTVFGLSFRFVRLVILSGRYIGISYAVQLKAVPSGRLHVDCRNGDGARPILRSV